MGVLVFLIGVVLSVAIATQIAQPHKGWMRVYAWLSVFLFSLSSWIYTAVHFGWLPK